MDRDHPSPPDDPGRRHPAPTRRTPSQRIRSRGSGLLLLAVGGVIAASIVLVPVPDFEELEPRTGTLLDARRDRFSPCSRGDCTRTLVTVRHEEGSREYHFGDADLREMEEGEPITVWTYPEFRGLDRRRAWHAVQGDRVIRNHGPAAASDRGIRLVLGLLMPFLIGGGGWLALRYDWQGRRVGSRP